MTPPRLGLSYFDDLVTPSPAPSLDDAKAFMASMRLPVMVVDGSRESPVATDGTVTLHEWGHYADMSGRWERISTRMEPRK